MARNKVEHQVTVWTSERGVPQRLVWNATRWVVTDRPTLWVERDRWWELPTKAGERRTTSGYPVWRTQISPVDTNKPAVVVDIARRGEQWLVLNVFD